jgi:tetratricopeptide (TPR) repeat protein
VALACGDRRLLTQAHEWQLHHRLELADGAGVAEQLDAIERLASRRADRYTQWTHKVVRARQAHLEGRLEDAETLALEALAPGFGGQDEAPAQTFGVQLLFVRREQGRLGELLDAVRGFVENFPAIPAWRCALALVYLELGQPENARAEVEVVATNGFGAVPRDGLWLGAMSVLAEVVAGLRESGHAARLYELLRPFEARCAVIAAAVCQGAVARALGLLAAALGRTDAAAGHFSRALTINAEIGAELWLAHTRVDYARVLAGHDAAAARELCAAAGAAAERLGLTSVRTRLGALDVRALTV